MEKGEKHPIVPPKYHHISQLVAKHYHHEVHHQGRKITGGAIRQAGFWLIGGHDIITRVIGACVLCKKLRGPSLEQHMNDLSPDRTEVCPLFINVSLAPGRCKHAKLDREQRTLNAAAQCSRASTVEPFKSKSLKPWIPAPLSAR